MCARLGGKTTARASKEAFIAEQAHYRLRKDYSEQV
jgi:hypothetical protein